MGKMTQELIEDLYIRGKAVHKEGKIEYVS